MSTRDFLHLDERDIQHERAESRNKISRLVNAISNSNKSEPPPLPHRPTPLARSNSHQQANDDYDSPPPPDYEMSMLQMNHPTLADYYTEEAPRRRPPSQQTMPMRPIDPSKTVKRPMEREPSAVAKAELSSTSAARPESVKPSTASKKLPRRTQPPPQETPQTKFTSSAQELSSLADAKSLSRVAPTPLSTAIAGMDSRAKQAAERRVQLHAAASDRVRARQQQLEEENRERERKEADAHFSMLEERRKKKEEDLEELAKKQELSRAVKQKIRRADEFRDFQLISRCGWSPWMRLIEEKCLNYQKAKNFAQDALLQRTWNKLYGYYRAKRQEQYRALARKETVATAHYRRILIKFSWDKWRFLRRMERAKAIAVQNQAFIFSRLRTAMFAWKMSYEKKMRAKSHLSRRAYLIGRRCLWKYYLNRWKCYMEEAALEREIEMRTRATWSKVKAWL